MYNTKAMQIAQKSTKCMTKTMKSFQMRKTKT